MKSRHEILDYLRGIAALLVVFCHLQHTLPKEAADIIKHGELAVYGFFVISGFIIPYSMIKSGYRIEHFSVFWVKRLLRLQPVYIAAILLTFVLSHVAAHFKGQRSDFSEYSFLKSLFYLYVPPENVVIWTLIVELKFYFLVSILFPIIFSSSRLLRISSVSILSLCSFALTPHFADCRFLPFFLLGFTACYLATGMASYYESLGLAAVATVFASITSTWTQVAAGLLTFTLIYWDPKFNSRIGLYLGAISYSLYLVHYPLVVKFSNFILPRVGMGNGYVVFVLATILAIVCANIIHWLIEAPSSKWSHAIKFIKS